MYSFVSRSYLVNNYGKGERVWRIGYGDVMTRFHFLVAFELDSGLVGSIFQLYKAPSEIELVKSFELYCQFLGC